MSLEKRTTIYDIAKRLKLSPSTVSRVMAKSKHPVKAEVRDRILKTAEEMGYIPNAQARFMKTQTNPSIGVIIPNIDNPFYPAMVKGMEDEAIMNDYSIYLCCSNGDVQRTEKQVKAMQEQNVNGIIAVYLDFMPTNLEDFSKRGGNIVMLSGKTLSFDGAYSVTTDKVAEAEMATNHLISLGHRRIALFIDAIDQQIRRDKVFGYKNALKNAGIEFNSDYLYVYGKDLKVLNEHVNYTSEKATEQGKVFVDEMLKRSPEVTALLCMNDMMALGVCTALREKHIKVPEEYSVMGFDDSFFSKYVSPSISTIGIKKYEWGRTLMKYMFQLINGDVTYKNMDEKELLEPIYLIQRESTFIPR